MGSNCGFSLIYLAFKDAFKLRGCPVCSISAASATRYLKFLLHENVNSLTSRINIHRSWGFCNEHAWELKEMEEKFYHTALGYPIILEGLLNSAISVTRELREQLAGKVLQNGDGGFFRRKRKPAGKIREIVDRLKPSGPCPACKARDEASNTYASFFMRFIVTEEFREMFDNSDGLCLRHFLSCLEKAENPEALITLVDSQLGIWGSLSRELGEYLRKMDYRYSQEPKGTEQDSWIRCIRVISGNNKDDNGPGSH
ncbi:MAG: DUF6062 family protein [Syntrophomonadaceae bacterium]|nr:DUF6062 family protein [Syntrophomonadaceae bacterium]